MYELAPLWERSRFIFIKIGVIIFRVNVVLLIGYAESWDEGIWLIYRWFVVGIKLGSIYKLPGHNLSIFLHKTLINFQYFIYKNPHARIKETKSNNLHGQILLIRLYPDNDHRIAKTSNPQHWQYGAWFRFFICGKDDQKQW